MHEFGNENLKVLSGVWREALRKTTSGCLGPMGWLNGRSANQWTVMSRTFAFVTGPCYIFVIQIGMPGVIKMLSIDHTGSSI